MQSKSYKPEISLSPRERAIAQLVAQGLPNKCIAKNLNISHWTVATYVRRIFIKLGVCSRTAMIALLIQENLLWD
ncbi:MULTISPECIES: helix-turn-helix transcriptional regulator [Microcoleus]|uniref:helix-turn-helix transcriptional regulator n=1 Tax=Microcoleus TaxID=44471 RepID=UPI002FD36CF2